MKNLYCNASTDKACATHQYRDSVYSKHYQHTYMYGDYNDPFEDKFQCSTEVDTDNRTQVNKLIVTDSESRPNVLTGEADLSAEMEPSHSAGMSADDNLVVDLLPTQLTVLLS